MRRVREAYEPAQALGHLKKATAWDPLSPPFLCAQARAQAEQGDLNGALNTLDQAEQSTPDNPQFPYVRAVILANNHQYAEAQIAISQAIKIRPDFAPALILLKSLPQKGQNN